MAIRTLIVDDMPLARERIKTFLAESKEIEIVGECRDGGDAIAAIQKLKPDLVFLDVQMPGLNGFEVIELIGVEQMPAVIFVTAFDEFAIRAFEVNAVDYLLKPFNEERLSKTLKRAFRDIRHKQTGRLDRQLEKLLAEVKKETKYLQRIIIKSGDHTILLATSDIDWISAAGNYLEIHVGSETYLLRERLSVMEQKLSPDLFIRIHRSTIVKIDFIKAMHPLFNGDHLVVLCDDTELNMSRTYYEKLKQIL